MVKVPGNDNVTDGLTKLLDTTKFVHFKELILMCQVADNNISAKALTPDTI